MAASYITLYRKQKNIIRGKLITATAVDASTEDKIDGEVGKRVAVCFQNGRNSKN